MEKTKEMMNPDFLDEETALMTKRMVVIRISTKHINLWMRQLETKRKEIGELAELLKLDQIKKEVETVKSLESWSKRTTNYFTKNAKRMLFEEVDNMVWNGSDDDITRWCQKNKVYDEISDEEIEEIWKREDSDEEPIRLNGKCVWETAKRVCNYKNAHEDIIRISSFGEYRDVMKKVMRVIKEAYNVERRRRQTARKKRAKSLEKGSRWRSL